MTKIVAAIGVLLALWLILLPTPRNPGAQACQDAAAERSRMRACEASASCAVGSGWINYTNKLQQQCDAWVLQ